MTIVFDTIEYFFASVVPYIVDLFCMNEGWKSALCYFLFGTFFASVFRVIFLGEELNIVDELKPGKERLILDISMLKGSELPKKLEGSPIVVKSMFLKGLKIGLNESEFKLIIDQIWVTVGDNFNALINISVCFGLRCNYELIEGEVLVKKSRVLNFKVVRGGLFPSVSSWIRDDNKIQSDVEKQITKVIPAMIKKFVKVDIL